MENEREDHSTEANSKLNREFYGEETQPTGWINNGSANPTDNANMQIDRIFNEEDTQFDLENSASLSRSNG